MKSFKASFIALAIPLLSLQASDIDYYYDYGYPPPLNNLESFGTVVVGAEWLYMKPVVDELYYAEKAVFTPGASGCITRDEPSFRWDSGVRVHLGYDLPCDQWMLDVSYTYFWTQAASADTFTNNFPSLNPDQTAVISGTISPVLFDEISASLPGEYDTNGVWKWRYNQLDIDFSRVSYFNRAVTFRPVVGFRFVWSEQNLNTAFAFIASDSSDDSISVGTFNKNDFNAFGLKFGVDTTWDIGFSGLALYGNFDYSVLLGRANLRQDLVLTQTIAPGTPPFAQNLTFKDSPRTLKQMATLAFGLQWATNFNCDESQLVVKAGWEYIYFSGFNMLVARDADMFTVENLSMGAAAVPVSHTLRGDMGLYGLVLGADYYF